MFAGYWESMKLMITVSVIIEFVQEETSGVGGALLKAQPTSPPPDMSPFFLRQYVKVSLNNCFVQLCK